MPDKEKDEIQSATATPSPSVEEGKLTAIDDPQVEQFYGSSTTESYRLKSELVGKCLEEIGMGRSVIRIPEPARGSTDKFLADSNGNSLWLPVLGGSSTT